MKPTDLRTAINLCIDARRPVFIWGPPGIGKTQQVHQACAERDLACVTLQANLMDPVDLNGLPIIDGGRTVWARPGMLPTDGEGVLFLDELNTASPAVQKVLEAGILSNRIGDHGIPAGWRWIAAGNRTTDRAGSQRTTTTLNSRFVHVDADVDLADWKTWALANNVPVEIVAFINFKPGLLHDFDPDARAFPTPRTWEFVGDLIKRGLPATVEYDLIAGTVGEGAASEFVAFLRVWRQLPQWETIMSNPKGAPLPDEPSARYAVVGMLATRATRDNMAAVLTYAGRLDPEYTVLAVKDATSRDPSLQATDAVIRWGADHGHLLT